MIGAIVLAQLCVTLPLALRLNVWVDEAYTLHTTGSGIATAVSRALSFEMQPPAYFAALGAWRSLDPGVFVARLFSIACAALAIPVVAWTSRRYCPGLHPGWLAAAIAFSPGALWAAVEARPYALCLLLSASLLGCFQAGFLATEPRRGWRIAYSVLALVALHTQYYLGFLLAANAAALALLRRWRTLAEFAAWMLPVAIGFAPILALVPDQVTSHTATSQRVAAVRSLFIPLVNFEMLAFGIERLAGGRAVRWLYRGALLVLLIGAFRGGHARIRKPGPDVVGLLASVVFLGACFAALPMLFGHWAALARHTISLLPAGLLVLYGALGAGRSPLPLAGTLALLLAGTGWIVRSDFTVMAKQGDHARVARAIEQRDSQARPILVFPSEQALALAYHHSGPGPIVPLPAPASLTRYDPRTFAWRSPDHVRTTLRGVLGPALECWLVTYGVEQTLDHPLHPELLEDEVAARFTTLGRWSFHDGTTLRLLRRLDAQPPGGDSAETSRRHDGEG